MTKYQNKIQKLIDLGIIAKEDASNAEDMLARVQKNLKNLEKETLVKQKQTEDKISNTDSYLLDVFFKYNIV